MKRPYASVLLLAAMLSPSSIAAQQAVIPPLVVKDGQGDIIGPVAGFASLTEPIFRLVDPDSGVPVFLVVVDSDTLAGAVSTTYFSGADCTGTAYHQANLGEATSGLADLTGYAYSVAVFEGTTHLIRSERSAAGATTNYDSFSDGESCFNTMQSKFLRPAVDVLDLELEYPPAYTAQ